MKKLLTSVLVLTLVFAGVGLLLPQEAHGQTLRPVEECTMVRTLDYGENTYNSGQSYDIDDNDGEGAVACAVNIVYRITEVLMWLMVALVVLFIVLGGFFILTAGGSEDKVSKGKSYITYSIIGVVVAVFAYAAPWIINFVVG